MSDPAYVPDHLYERLFQPWTLPESEWPLCKEDWARVDAITALPWAGYVLDYGCGDGTLGAMVRSRNPLVRALSLYDRDGSQIDRAAELWEGWHSDVGTVSPAELQRLFRYDFKINYDGALCCEVLEHMTPNEGQKALCDIKRVLKPGGMLCVTVPNQAGPRAAYPGHVREFTIAELGRTVTDAGFRVVDGDAIGGKIIPVWFMAVCRA